MGEESPSNSVDRATNNAANHPADHPANHGANGSASGPPTSEPTRYEVGPGFEIAIRAALNHPMEFQVKREGEGAEPNKAPAGADHRHVAIEKRLDAIERALFIMVDQLKRIDEQLSPERGRPLGAQNP